MHALPLAKNLKQILCLGAHCDDVEIGCGGTLAALVTAHPDVQLTIVVFSGNAVRSAETRAAVGRLLPEGMPVNLEIHQFRDGFFPVEWASIKERFEDLARRVAPDLIITHYEQDKHQDHRMICELTWNTFRDHLLLEYEVPKYDGDLGRPNLYIPLEPEVVRRKMATLMECFPSQAGRRWFTEDLFAGLMRLRGMECNSPSGFAEAFYVRKLVVAC